MAKIPNGLHGPVTGRVGNGVYYQNKFGTNIYRGIGLKTSSADTELPNQQRTALVTKLLRPVSEFIKVGFHHVPAKKTFNYYTYATSVNKLGAIKGEYPNQEIDYEKVLFSIGNIPLPKAPGVILDNSVLEFSWENDLETDGTSASDQIMLVVYFPASTKAIFMFSGARRSEEKQIVKLPLFTKNMVIETYMSFISDDRKSISNSVHISQLIWDKL